MKMRSLGTDEADFAPTYYYISLFGECGSCITLFDTLSLKQKLL